MVKSLNDFLLAYFDQKLALFSQTDTLKVQNVLCVHQEQYETP